MNCTRLSSRPNQLLNMLWVDNFVHREVGIDGHALVTREQAALVKPRFIANPAQSFDQRLSGTPRGREKVEVDLTAISQVDPQFQYLLDQGSVALGMGQDLGLDVNLCHGFRRANGRAFRGEPSERNERPERKRGRRVRCNAMLGANSDFTLASFPVLTAVMRARRSGLSLRS